MILPARSAFVSEMIESKHPDFIVREREPLNGGPPPALAAASFITPNDLFFVRNHAPVPTVNLAAYRLTVEGLVERVLSLSLDDLAALPRASLTAALQCAGNRRRELEAIAPIPDEIIWDAEAVGNAIWTGVRLRDVLGLAGLQDAVAHVHFEGLDPVDKPGEQGGFGGSIPVEKALSSEVLLADTMNGVPLPPAHGFPLRVIVPGFIGARSVKWLSRITAAAHPSSNYYQTRAYKLFPPSAQPGSVDWDAGLMLGELPINSVICQPVDGASLPAGEVIVRGHALVGGGRSIARVDVSADGGQTWIEARLTEAAPPWSWWLWEAALQLAPGTYQIVARAWDTAANSQPERVESVWNFKGYMNNACHRLTLTVTA